MNIDGLLAIMKKTFSQIACAGAMWGLFATAGIAAGVPAALPGEAGGAAAPVFSLPGQAGSVDLAAFRGQLVYLDFWASWCGPCKQSFPFMNTMQRKYGARGLRVIAINVDQARADADLFLRAVPAEFTIAFDAEGKSPGQYAVKGMPSSVLIGRDGRVISTHVGFKKSDEARLERAIVAALESGT